jgi:large subunit ribosomal protein L21
MILHPITRGSGGDDVELVAQVRRLRAIRRAPGEAHFEAAVDQHLGRAAGREGQHPGEGQRDGRRGAVHRVAPCPGGVDFEGAVAITPPPFARGSKLAGAFPFAEAGAMYAVIKTGGKQYRVEPGDVLVVEKLAGEPGAKVAFDQVLLVGEGEAVTVGAPIVEGASVDATLIETRRGEKIKIFKKIRRQGYRRTRGHRQTESVLRVTAIAGGGKTETWDGEVDLTPLAVLNLRARNLARAAAEERLTPAAVDVETVAEPQGKGKTPRVKARVVEEAEAVAAEAQAGTPEARKGAPKAKAAKAPTSRDAAKASAPKASKAQARAPVRRTSPRGKG